MDSELLVALVVLWTSTTIALFAFLHMWFMNQGESFHPHSVDIEHRHNSFLVVNSKTFCKYDCPVKSISLFAAPRGSSSSKYFTVMCCIIAISGLFGTIRWYYVNDASFFEATLSFLGFISLLLVATFELDVVPERFLEDKLLVTGWLIEKLNLQKELDFDVNTYNESFLNFIRSSNEIYYLYDEDIYLKNRTKKFKLWKYHSFWPTLHMLGCCTYIILVPTAIILNDIAEEKVAWITGLLFSIFSFMAYLTGNYVPVIDYFRCWILLWNPFLNEPHFMLKLKKAIEEYNRRKKETHFVSLNNSTILENNNNLVNRKNKKKNDKELQNKELINEACDDTILRIDTNSSFSSQVTTPNSFNSEGFANFKENLYQNKSKSDIKSPTDSNFLTESLEIDRKYINNNMFLRFARYHPNEYLTIIGHLFVMTELIAILTPSVGMGIQWITALCDGPPLLSIIEMFEILLTCLFSGDCSLNNEKFHHCILKSHS